MLFCIKTDWLYLISPLILQNIWISFLVSLKKLIGFMKLFHFFLLNLWILLKKLIDFIKLFHSFYSLFKNLILYLLKNWLNILNIFTFFMAFFMAYTKNFYNFYILLYFFRFVISMLFSKNKLHSLSVHKTASCLLIL